MDDQSREPEGRGGGPPARPVGSLEHAEGQAARPVINKALAAYCLGYKSRYIEQALELLYENPCGALLESLKLLVGQLRTDKDALVNEIVPGTSVELDGTIGELEQFISSLAPKLYSTDPDDELWEEDTRHPPSQEVWKRFMNIGDRALPMGHGLRPLYEFGAKLGEYSLELSRRHPRSSFDASDVDLHYRRLDEGLPELLPDFASVIQKAASLPQEMINQIPHIYTIVQLASTPGDITSRDIIIKLVRIRGDLNKLSHREYCGSSASQMALALDDIVRDGLTKLDGDALALRTLAGFREARLAESHDADKPKWDKERRQLFFRGDLLKSLRFDAINIIAVLEAFEETGWASWVDNPIKCSYLDQSRKARAESTARDFNRTCKHIKLRTRDNGKQFGWEVC